MERPPLVRLRLAVTRSVAFPDGDVMRRGILATETEFLQKPFTPDELLRHVPVALDARPAPRAA